MRPAVTPVNRNGIALMVTLFFIIAITVALGVSLRQLKEGTAIAYEGRFVVQTASMLEDVLGLLKNAPELKNVKDAMSLNLLLTSASVIPISVEGADVMVTLSSEMGKLDVNALSNPDSPLAARVYTFLQERYYVQDPAYFGMLLADCMGGEKVYYNTEIFEHLPQLYRSRIVDRRHFDEILGFYAKMRHDGNIFRVPWERLVRFDDNTTKGIDVNYATPEVWQMMLPGLSEERAVELTTLGGTYTALPDTGLSDEEIAELAVFEPKTYLPKVKVGLSVMVGESRALIGFDYDLNSTTPKGFTYAI